MLKCSLSDSQSLSCNTDTSAIQSSHGNLEAVAQPPLAPLLIRMYPAL